MHSLDEIRALIEKYGLTRHAGLIERSLVPAIRLQSAKEISASMPVGASKFGGDPDLPEGVLRPTRKGEPMHLLAQIRLSELPRRHVAMADLPERGVLWAWVDNLGLWETCITGEVSDGGPSGHLDPSTYVLTYEPDENRPLSPTAFPGYSVALPSNLEDLVNPYPQVAMSPRAVQVLRPEVLDELRELNRRAAEVGKAGPDPYDFARTLQEESRTNHQLLGDFHCYDEDLRMTAQARSRELLEWDLDEMQSAEFERTKQEWRLLLRLDSDFGNLDWCWGDAGSLFWYIRSEDLANRRFDRACGMLAYGG